MLVGMKIFKNSYFSFTFKFNEKKKVPWKYDFERGVQKNFAGEGSMSNRVVEWSTKKSGVKIQGTGEGVADMNFNETINPDKTKSYWVDPISL